VSLFHFEHVATSCFFFATVIMDILHTQLNHIQRHLAFVAVDDIDWRFYVQLSSWSVSLFESYLLCVWVLNIILTAFLNFFKGFDSILYTPRQNLRHYWRSILNQVYLKSPKTMGKIKPSSLCSQASSSSSWIPLCCNLGFIHGLGVPLKAS
jgi:hypothetical protein